MRKFLLLFWWTWELKHCFPLSCTVPVLLKLYTFSIKWCMLVGSEVDGTLLSTKLHRYGINESICFFNKRVYASRQWSRWYCVSSLKLVCCERQQNILTAKSIGLCYKQIYNCNLQQKWPWSSAYSNISVCRFQNNPAYSVIFADVFIMVGSTVLSITKPNKISTRFWVLLLLGVVITEWHLCWVWLMLSVIYAECSSCLELHFLLLGWVSVFNAECYLCWVYLMLSVIYAECYLWWVLHFLWLGWVYSMLSAFYAGWSYAGCYLHWV